MYDDLIDRLHRYTENCVAYKLDADFASAVQEAADVIERKHGEWERALDYNDVYGMRCSLCGEFNGVDRDGWNWTPNYCPNCGARMDGDDDV